MTTDYYVMVSIWFALSATAGNKKGDFITCTQSLSVMAVIVKPSFYGLSSLIRQKVLKRTSAWSVVVSALKT